MKINANDLRVFVPYGDSGRDTAVLLIGSAKDAEVDPEQVKKVSGGYLIPGALAEYLMDEGVIYDPDDEDVSEEDEEDEDSEEPFVPGNHSIPQVKDFVNEYPDSVEDVILSEEAGQNRPTLMEWLRSKQASGNRAEENQAQDKE